MMRSGCSRMSKWANTMNTSEFDQSSPAQQGFTENSNHSALLPDVDQLTKLANELFSALPCDGSRLGLAASAVQSGSATSLTGFDQAGIPGQGFGLPGDAELRQLFAPRKLSFESVPDSIDTGSILGNQPNGLASPLAGLDKAVLSGLFQHDFGLPGEDQLQKLLVTPPPSASIAAVPAADEALADADKSVAEGISSQVFQTELQKLFAANNAAAETIQKNGGGQFGTVFGGNAGIDRFPG